MIDDYTDDIIEFLTKLETSDTFRICYPRPDFRQFFNINSDIFYELNETITVRPYNFNIEMPMINIIKTKNENNQNAYIFECICKNTENNNNLFHVRSIIDQPKKFTTLLTSTIQSLREYKDFVQYADDLEALL